MSETVERRPPFLRSGLGCFVGVFTAVAVLLTLGGVWGYFALRDLDSVGDLDVDIPDIDFDALLPPEADRVTALDTTTGQERWTRRFGHGALPVGVSNDVVIVRKRNGDIQAVNASTGLDLWQRSTSDSAGYPQLGGSTVVFISQDREVIALDALTGAERWRTSDVAVRTDLRLVNADLAIVRSRQRNQLMALDVATGDVRWSAPSPGRASDLVSPDCSVRDWSGRVGGLGGGRGGGGGIAGRRERDLSGFRGGRVIGSWCVLALKQPMGGAVLSACARSGRGGEELDACERGRELAGPGPGGGES